MCCLPDKERVIFQLNGLNSHALVIERGEVKPGFLELLDVVGVHLVAVSVTLFNNINAPIQRPQLAPFCARFEV